VPGKVELTCWLSTKIGPGNRAGRPQEPDLRRCARAIRGGQVWPDPVATEAPCAAGPGPWGRLVQAGVKARTGLGTRFYGPVQAG